MTKGYYRNKTVAVTGGAGFIGHHLTDKLIELGAVTTVVDNLSSGSMGNVIRVWKRRGLKYRKTNWGYQADLRHRFVYADLQEYQSTVKTLNNHELLFHLAANIGGRGYINTHPADCCEGFAINQNVIKAAYQIGVERVQFASSACVYPINLQQTYHSRYLLKETDAFRGDWASADREYGWAKLMGEITLQAYHNQYHLQGSITRYVTAYGPYENDTHAIIMLIRRALNHEDPYVIWGSGKQDRDFTYVDDIVDGTLAAAEHIVDAGAVNLGTATRYSMVELTNIIFDLIGWRPRRIIFDRTKPEGVRTRALDISRATRLLNWKPKVNLKHGLQKTIKWFDKTNPLSVESIR
ncbi:NAD-dependent epimerase/dehydratase family protein [Patescibacteria group bacterium]|nr:NAD-dependent epimerase/dehydratase family protein [Patescibacteria group bacterium]MCL5091853.1 NAD-dependent epimerase/dehydratase family protein [Patescibacteria group bacterium]